MPSRSPPDRQRGQRYRCRDKAKGDPMGMPGDIPVIDTLIGLPSEKRTGWSQSMAGILRDQESLTGAFDHPAGYMYKHVPQVKRTNSSAEELMAQMDRHNIELGLVP